MCWSPLSSHQLTCSTGAAYPTLLPKAKPIAPTISHAWGDKGYTGQALTTAAAKAGVTVDVISRPKPGHGFIVAPRRWVVERTNEWNNHSRRIDHHYETTLIAQEGFIYLSQTALPLRRLDRSVPHALAPLAYSGAS
ncbi:hypothetical protein A5765_06685 [Mycolicibacterium celeriflavum]|uniref:Uncharacterized protein n=1 Tax=Mycolicibacterium celeriflavum TaxID=1249101 RepID=A0A1X0BU53_MYCCF|nr:transposase [Mycolicibacterium celeriflavum]MCV7240788.1 transposase [Mycolicibacterium celeriflavum]OBG17334.1 hypothetical protein A5765_06685 [Mycolicibacterium celeriflavum]ORA47457.1 hypothetical protein BST21_12115 [Mycolicibacterium celeriflavum]BBY42507.1 hypothetical protein MCEL_08020 [Mycolicibacterium celeriflavum]